MIIRLITCFDLFLFIYHTLTNGYYTVYNYYNYYYLHVQGPLVP